jgi:hypothetical protein
MVSIDNADGNGGFTMDFSGDSLYLLAYADYGTLDPHLMRTPVKYKQDDWNDISLIFNATTNKMTLKLNNVQILNAVDADQTGYEFLEFYAGDIASGFTTRGEFYIDDIVYRRIPNIPQVQPEHVSMPNASISPNPANEKFVVSPDINTLDAWQIQLINSVGQVVLTRTGVGATPLEIATGDFAQGVYIVDYQSDATRWTKKLVIRH